MYRPPLVAHIKGMGNLLNKGPAAALPTQKQGTGCVCYTHNRLTTQVAQKEHSHADDGHQPSVDV